MSDTISPNQNVGDLVKKGEQIYKESMVDAGREKELNGQYVAIEVDSKDIFSGSTKEDVLDQASRKYPGKIFYVRRVGFLDAVSSRIPLALRV